MRRSLLAISIFSLLTATSLFASSAQSDLLSKATDGAITTAKADSVKVLSHDEMGDVKGAGWKAPIYSAAFSSFRASPVMTPMQRLAAYTRVK